MLSGQRTGYALAPISCERLSGMATVNDARLIPVRDPNGTLTIGDVDLHNGFAWQVTNTADLWLQAVRGSNLLVPGMAGVLPGPKRPTVTEMVFPLIMVGAFDEAGVENADAELGLIINRDELRSRLQLPPPLPAITRTATWTRWDGLVLVTEVSTVDVAINDLPGHASDWVLTIESMWAWEQAGS